MLTHPLRSIVYIGETRHTNEWDTGVLRAIDQRSAFACPLMMAFT